MSTLPAILMVEDNEDDVILIKRALKKGGIAAPVHIATDGEDAVNYLAAAGRYQDESLYPVPKLVLLDLKLPKISGHEVLEWIRSHDSLANLAVVVFTTSTEPADLERAYTLGANSYLKKPATLDQTADMLKVVGTYWLGYNEQAPSVQRRPA